MSQVKFFNKNHIDLDRPNPVLSVVDAVALNDGAAYLKYLRNRNNNSGWNTTGSTDAANTQLLFELFDLQKVDVVMLVVHNFKNYLIEYWDILTGSWQTYANVINNTEEQPFTNLQTLKQIRFALQFIIHLLLTTTNQCVK